jgi:hypothetical protein
MEARALAFIRAVCCERLRDCEAAALFYSSVLIRSPEEPEAFMMPMAQPLLLAGNDQLDEAWEYVTIQLKYIPNPVTLITRACAL